MNLAALALVLLGSLLHLGWNILAKGAKDGLAFLWLALLPPAVLGVPLVAGGLLRGEIPAAGAACLAATSCVHFFYFRSLAAAYEEGDLSFVYPYSRSIGAFLAALAGVVLLGERPSVLGAFGIILTLAGTLVEPLSAKAGPVKGLSLALRTGLAIGGYFLVDKLGVRSVRPEVYLCGLSFGAALLMSPLMVPTGRARAELARSRWRPFWGMIFSSASYAFVLAAMQRAPVGYVVAVRSCGIIASGAAGALFFHEAVGPGRWAAIALITAGICCIGFA